MYVLKGISVYGIALLCLVPVIGIYEQDEK